MSPLMTLYVIIGTLVLFGVGAMMRARREPAPIAPIPDDVMRHVIRRAVVWALVLVGATILLVITRRTGR